MTKLNIVWFPDSVLTKPTQKVEKIDAEIQQLIDDMFETMYAVHGIGLAANQVGIAKHLAVIDVSETHDKPLVLINPEIIEYSTKVEMSEGCLSVPGHYDKIMRAERVRFKALDRDGKPYEMDAKGLLAHCVQHEIDHLNGTMYVHYLSQFKRDRVLEKLRKLKKKK